MNESGSHLTEWLARIDSFSPQEIDLGLDRVLLLVNRLRVEAPTTVLHFAGTNGKGSSVAMAAALLAESDCVVGAYTSPHVLYFNERIRVDNEAASDDEIVSAFERIDAARGDVPLTYFEFGTLAALLVFEARDVEVALLEVGMGGRLDAVNAIEPSAGLITNVALDHCDWLGNDVEAIAFEKAGIMRAGKPVVFASHDVSASILARAEETAAQLLLVGRDYSWKRVDDRWSWDGQTKRLSGLRLPALRGAFQLGNAAGVLALLESVGFDAQLDADSVNRAFTSLRLTGRMQSVRTDRNWLLDVAHNPAAAESLATTLRADACDAQTIAIIAMLEDKDVDGVISALADQVSTWIAVTAGNKRAIGAEELARRVANLTNRACMIAETVHEAMEFAREITTSSDRIVVSGSFYLVGPALEALEMYSRR